MKKNYKVWDIKPLSDSSIEKKNLFLHLIEWAILAASSHNVQPWRFIIRPSQNIIDICVDEAGVLPVSDVKGRQAYISMGCAIENLLFAAEYYGFVNQIEYFDGAPIYPLPIVRVRLEKDDKVKRKDKKFLEAIKNRRMNRKKFDPECSIPDKVLEQMREIAKNFGLTLDIITDNPTRFAIAEIQYVADKYVVAKTDFRKELSEFLLPNDTDKNRGMPGNTFGLSDEMALRIHKELKKDGIFDPYLATGFAASSRDGIKSSPAILVISVKNDNPEWWVKAGRVFQKIALLAEMYGLSISVQAAIVEVEMFNKMLGLRLKHLKLRPTVIFRMGYAKEESPHSPRVGVEEVAEVMR